MCSLEQVFEEWMGEGRRGALTGLVVRGGDGPAVAGLSELGEMASLLTAYKAKYRKRRRKKKKTR